LVVDFHIPEIGEEVPTFSGVDRNQNSFLWNVNLDEVIAVGWTEVQELEVDAAKPEIHFFLEGNGGDDRVPVLSNQVRNDVHVAYPHRRVAEETRVTVVVLMIVTQYHIPHWHVITAIELPLEPLCCAGVAIVTVDNDDAFIGQDIGAILVIGAPAVDMF